MPNIKSLPGLGDDYTSQFSVGDIVYFKSDPQKRAFVARTWSTEEDDDFEGCGPLDRALLLGEVGLRVGNQGKRAIEPESILELLCRSLEPGDLVKRNVASPEVALVLSTYTECQVENALTCEKSDAWIPMDELTSVARFREGDMVVRGGWLGTVTVVAQVGRARTPEGDSYQICDTFGIMQVGDKASDVVDIYRDRGIEFSLPHGTGQRDRVWAAAPYGIEVGWLAMNQQIPPSEQWKYPPPQTWYSYEELDDLVRIGKALDKYCQVGRSYVLKDEMDYKRYGFDSKVPNTDVGETTALRVSRFRTKARLQWPDGHTTEEWANSMTIHHNMDEHESWPGQHVMWSDESNKKRHAVVQRYDPVQRIVDIRFSDTAEIETVPVIEVEHGNAHGSEYGAPLGEYVFICEASGSPLPHVPAIGLAPTTKMDPLVLLQQACQGAVPRLPRDCNWAGARMAPHDVDWFGRVVSLEMDGRVGIRRANGNIVTLGLWRVILLKMMDEDIMDLLSEGSGSNGSDGDDQEIPPASAYQGPINTLAQIVLANSRRNRPTNAGDDDVSDASWETAYSDEDDLQDLAMFAPMIPARTHENQDIVDAMDAAMSGESPVDRGLYFDRHETASEDADWVDDSIEMAPSSPPTRQSRSPSVGDLIEMAPCSPAYRPSRSPSPSVPMSTEPNAQAGPSSIPRDIAWESFAVLETAPSDHRYFGEAPASSSRARMKKINAEHKALRTSLSDNIVVRSYEDRLDLMRVLIIGPEGTPYAGAPFVFDVFLNPQYPFQPPTVHFHSHTNGKGRCNPNLYEEGKVCLSILGTWSGDASESWDVERSSLLQVFVSISGLVLVRNPYHCEPAYAKLEGTKEGSVNSRLYSEKAYVLSRGFVRQALASPPEGLQDEIRHYYYATGHLKDVIDHARALMNKDADVQGKEGDKWNADVIGSLTAGAKLSLKRVFQSLEKSWQDYQATVE